MTLYKKLDGNIPQAALMLRVNHQRKNRFNDAYSISSWAVEAVEYCYQAGIISGKGDNLFKPEDTASRAEVATIITNLIKAAVSDLFSLNLTQL